MHVGARCQQPRGPAHPEPGGQLGGQGQGDVTQPGRLVDRGQGPVGDFGQQGVGGAVTGGAVIIRGWFCPRRRPGLRPARRRWPGPGTRSGATSRPGWPTAGHGVWCGRPQRHCRGRRAVVLDQHVEEPAQVFGAVVAGEGHHGVRRWSAHHRWCGARPRIARTWSMVMALSANAVAVSGSTSRSARAVDPPAGMPRRGAGGCRQPVPRGAVPGQRRGYAAAGINRGQGFGQDRAAASPLPGP